MAGVDLCTVQGAGGWKTQMMVQRDAHLSPDHMRAAVERLASAARQGATDVARLARARDSRPAKRGALELVGPTGSEWQC